MAIVDPQLVLHMPKKLTAWGGIDALTHALESYVSILSTGGCAGGGPGGGAGLLKGLLPASCGSCSVYGMQRCGPQ